MSTHQPVITGKDLVKLLERSGFILSRINGSHHRMKHADGRVTTIPVHGNSEIPKGLLRKIVRDDLKMEMEEFAKLAEGK